MRKLVAIDAGKKDTKVCIYDENTNTTTAFKYSTKMSEGSFEDDSLESSTAIVEIDGKTYKIGPGALKQAEFTTSKTTEIHKNCILTALAMCCEGDEVNEFDVAIGLPVNEWSDVKKRNEYKLYSLPEGEIHIRLKTRSDGPICEKKFKICSRYVFIESQGALFLDCATEFIGKTAAVIDIGSLNINCTIWDAHQLDKEASLTDELGGNVLVSSLSQMLSSAFSRCSENYVEKLLRLPPEERYLHPTRPNPQIESESKALIEEHLLDHVREIKRKCDARKWSLDYMKLVFIGGTSDLLRKEITEVFGEEVYIPEHPEFANAIGFLRILGAKIYGGEKGFLPMPNSEHKSTKSAIEEKKAS